MCLDYNSSESALDKYIFIEENILGKTEGNQIAEL